MTKPFLAALFFATYAGLAFGTLQSRLIGASIPAVAQDVNATWTVSLTLPNGAPAAIVWNPKGARMVALPNGLIATQRIDLAGASTTLNSNRVAATMTPALFK